jgi:hypothetical protein
VHPLVELRLGVEAWWKEVHPSIVLRCKKTSIGKNTTLVQKSGDMHKIA